MCEIFGANAKNPTPVNSYLQEFYSHSCRHPHGWGIALLNEEQAWIEKEPLEADKSDYAKILLDSPIKAKVVLSHIRYATIGNVEYKNCHPFTGKDCTGRRWTMIHNGTIFDFAPLNGYVKSQNGDTDSERILLYILDRVNEKIEKDGALSGEQRFWLINSIVSDMAEGNKLNLLIYDEEYMYVHTNYENSLHYFQREDQVIVTTEALEQGEWKKVPMTTLFAYKNGSLVFTGTNHGHVYEDNEENMKFLYQIFSSL